MGNSQGSSNPVLVSRPYENVIKSIKENLKCTEVKCYERSEKTRSKTRFQTSVFELSPTVASEAKPKRESSENEDPSHVASSAEYGYHDIHSSLIFEGRNPSRIHDVKSTSGSRNDKYYQANKISVYGHTQNHKSFLEPQALNVLLPFLLDSSLSVCLSVCPHWFVTIYSNLQNLCEPIIQSFIQHYNGNVFDLEAATFSIQPIFTAGNLVSRVDLLLYCKVSISRMMHEFFCIIIPATQIMPICKLKCTQFGYSFSYKSSGEPSSIISPTHGIEDAKLPIPVLPPEQSSFGSKPKGNETYMSLFRFETQKEGSRRKVWFHRDVCRFHGDELMVASFPNVPTVNVGDRLEIPLNLANAFGLVDPDSIRWLQPEFIEAHSRKFGQLCEFDRQSQQWSSLDSFQSESNERLHPNDFFGPQWRHLKSEYTGIDITCTRSSFTAAEIGKACSSSMRLTGEVPNSIRWLGIEAVVKPHGVPIVCALTRLGLQHDRFSRQQGDQITLYLSQGGGILQ